MRHIAKGVSPTAKNRYDFDIVVPTYVRAIYCKDCGHITVLKYKCENCGSTNVYQTLHKEDIVKLRRIKA